ncbi:hypothetical protein SDC9_158709 [bioreactor metagenome]|uniref:Uncharacterized protein n=1 Tax=bioreactor metagenome TaxID=1076179 RepID=A0A645FAK7_9ZZZZ
MFFTFKNNLIASRLSIILSGKHLSRSSIRITSLSIWDFFNNSSKSSRNLRTTSNLSVSSFSFRNCFRKPSVSCPLILSTKSVGFWAASFNPFTNWGMTLNPPVINAAVAGNATFFMPNPITLIQFTDLNSFLISSFISVPNFFSSLNSLNIVSSKAAFASSYPSNTHPLK